jgi:molybdenum cofactor synthesis domain-containing protein
MSDGVTAGIVIIGDEILSGKTAEQNASFLIGELRELGVALRQIAVIPDVLDEIAATVRAFSERYDHVFTSGGVGPTHDDLTMEGVARAFGTRVVRHRQLEEMLRGYYGARLEERNLRMADVPDGCTLVVGDAASWPIVCYGNVYVLPGIPEIFRRKFVSMRERFRSAPFHLACIYTSDEEGRIAAHLDHVAARYPEVAVGSYPRIIPESDRGWRVKVTLESKDRGSVDRAVEELLGRLGDASVVRVDR